MATEIFINIKDLPELTDITTGNYIVVETALGTKILDFQNLILPAANTLISTTVEQNAQVVTDLTTSLASITGVYDTEISSLSTIINTISGNYVTLSGNSFQMYIGNVQITIPKSSTTASNNLTPSPSVTILPSDIVITPANVYASKNLAYVSSVNNGLVTIKSDFNTSAVTFNYSASLPLTGVSDVVAVLQTATLSSINGSATEDAIYNIMAIKKI
jgi:hypothetical protein